MAGAGPSSFGHLKIKSEKTVKVESDVKGNHLLVPEFRELRKCKLCFI